MTITKKPTKILCRGEDVDKALNLLNSDSEDTIYTFAPNKGYYLGHKQDLKAFMEAETTAALVESCRHSSAHMHSKHYEESTWTMSLTGICARLYYKLFSPAKNFKKLSTEVREKEK